jgi:hypothetical protein
MWNRYREKVQGAAVLGDPRVPSTRWWNHLVLLFLYWKTVIVFEVEAATAKEGYHVGYLPRSGRAMVKDTINHDQRFRMRIGREACTFFAIATDGTEIPIKIRSRTTMDDPVYQVPLH